jgi:hypothetical protein
MLDFLLPPTANSNIWLQALILGLFQQVLRKFLFSLSVVVAAAHQWRRRDMVVVGVV